MSANRKIEEPERETKTIPRSWDECASLVSEEPSNSVASVIPVMESDGDVASTNTYSLGIGNRLVEATFPSLSRTFGYDAAGSTVGITNIQSGATNIQTLAWDTRYRLTSAVQDSVFDIRYSYDVLGRRVSRTAGGSPASVEYYIHNGNQIVANLDASGIDNILSMTTYGTTATNTYFYLKDHQNTVIALTDDTGSVVESYEYNAYGQILDVKDSSGNSIANQQSAIGNRYTFQGREIDWDTRLMYFRARWYNLETGRWLSKDPIGIGGGLNQYVFVSNNSVNFMDPDGLLPGKIPFKGNPRQDASDAIVAEGKKNGINVPRDVADAIAKEMKIREGKKLQNPKTSEDEKEDIMKDIANRLRKNKKTPQKIKDELDRLEKEANKKKCQQE